MSMALSAAFLTTSARPEEIFTLLRWVAIALARLSVFLAFVSNFLALFVGLVAACPIKLVAWLLVIGRGPGPPSRRGLRRVAAGQR